MLKNTFILLFLFAFLQPFATAQVNEMDLEKVLEKYYDVMGDAEDWANIKSMQSSGMMEQMGMSFNWTMVQARPDDMRLEIEFNGSKMVHCMHADSGWTINPMTGSMAPRKMMQAEYDAMVENRYMEDRLVNYKEKGITVSLEGVEKVDEKDAIKLKVIDENENTSYLFLDAVTYMPIKLNQRVTQGMMGETEADMYMTKYVDVAGVKLPTMMEQKIKGQTQMAFKINSYEPNVDVGMSTFIMPKK